MVEKKSWNEFRDSGLLWWINALLHTFGWAIIFERVDGKIVDVYPARVGFRGFDEQTNTEGYRKLTQHLKGNIEGLEKDVAPKEEDK